MSNPPASPPDRMAVRLAAFYFASFGALGLFSPYFPLWLEAHGFSGASMGVICALTPAMNFLGPLLAGAISDARGARGNLLSLACALAAAAMAGLCVAEWFGGSALFGVVFAAVLAYAACRSPLILLADRISIEQGGNYGRRRVWGSVGFMLAATAFGRWCPPSAWRWLPGAVAVALGLAYLVSLTLPRTTGAPRAVAFRPARVERRGFPAFLCCTALAAASHSSYDLCGALFFRDLGASGDTIGLLYGVAVLAEIVLLASVAPVFTRFPAELLLGVAYAGAALRWWCLSLLGGSGLAFFVQPLHAVSFALMWVASLEYVRRGSGPHELGSAQGAFMAANAAGAVLGTLGWGPGYESHGGAFIFRIAAGLSLAAALVAYALLYRAGRRVWAPASS